MSPRSVGSTGSHKVLKRSYLHTCICAYLNLRYLRIGIYFEIEHLASYTYKHSK